MTAHLKAAPLVCGHDMAKQHILGRHPWDDAVWVREECARCGAERLVEHRMPTGDEDELTSAALPWRRPR